MLKRIVPLVLVVFAVAVPSALADDGAQPAPAQPKQHHTLKDVRQHIARAARACRSGKVDAETCKARAQRLLARLQKLDSAIDARIAKIKERCSAADAPERCQNADRRIERLQAFQQRVQKLAAKVQAWLDGKTTDPSTTPDNLASDLASLQQHNP